MANLTQKLSEEVFAVRVLECIKKNFQSTLGMPQDFISLHNRLTEEGFSLEHNELENALNFLVSKAQNRLTVSDIRLSIIDMTKISFKLFAF